jgi:hypothetical protein
MSRLVFKDPERSRLAVEQAVRDARGRGTGALGALIRRLGQQLRAVGLDDPKETARTLLDLAAAELAPAVGNNLPPPVGGLGPRKPILTSAGIYPSAAAAAAAFTISIETARHWARTGINGWRYVSKDEGPD